MKLIIKKVRKTVGIKRIIRFFELDVSREMTHALKGAGRSIKFF